jgi:hypothetical protein
MEYGGSRPKRAIPSESSSSRSPDGPDSLSQEQQLHLRVGPTTRTRNRFSSTWAMEDVSLRVKGPAHHDEDTGMGIRPDRPISVPPPPPPPPLSPRPSGRARRPKRALLAIVFGALFLLVGIGVGWVIRDAQSGSSRMDTIGTWATRPIDVVDVCGETGQDNVSRMAIPGKEGPLPLRLSDHMPDRSPVEGFQRAFDGPVGPSETQPAGFTSFGVGDGYARTFNNSPGGGPGGFTVYAYDFPSEASAVGALTVSYVDVVCRFGADPFTVEGHPGVLVAFRGGEAARSTVSWVHGNRLIEVRYSIWGDPVNDFQGLLTVGRVTWELDRVTPQRDV